MRLPPPWQVSDNIVDRIGEIGKAYGQAFGVEAWASELFAEEVREARAWRTACVV